MTSFNVLISCAVSKLFGTGVKSETKF